MNKFSKQIVSAVVVSLMAVAFAGCSSGSSTQPANSASPQASAAPQKSEAPKNVSLRFSWWGSDDRHKATLAAIDLYQKKNPNVKIEAEYTGFDGYEQKIKTQLAGGTAPDVMQLDVPWLAELTTGDLLVDMNNQKSVDLKGYDANFLKNFLTYNNKVVGLPMGTNGRTFVINKTAADKLGVPADTVWTWDSLLQEGKKLHDKDKKYYLLNSDLGLVQIMFSSILRQRTGSTPIKDDNTLAFSKEQAVEALDWVHKAYQAGVYQPLGESQLFNGKTDQNPKWINQEIVATEGWSSEVGKYKGPLPKDSAVATVLPPAFKDSKTGAAILRPSMSLSVSKKSPNQEEALKFANWLLSDKEAALALGDVRAVPAQETARAAVVEANKLDKDVAKAVELASKSQAVPDNGITQNSQIIEIQKDVIQKVAFDKLTPDQGADEMIKRLTDKLKELKK